MKSQIEYLKFRFLEIHFSCKKISMNIIELISQPWHWSISGFMISLVMFLLIYFGHRFGVSSSFRALCSIGGAGSKFDYFNYDWKNHDWLLVFILGSIIGGGIASTWFASPNPVAISEATSSKTNHKPSNNQKNKSF